MSTLKVTNLQHGSATAPAISVAVGGGATVLGITTFHNGVDSSERLTIGGSTVTDANLLTLNGSGAAQNVGIVLNKTNSPAKAHGIQVNNTTGDLIFFDYTASAERLRVDSSGNVGINETTPDSKIDTVYHTSENSATANLIHLRADPSGGYATRGLFVKIGRDGAYDNSAVHYDIVGSSGNSGFHAFEVQGDEKLRIDKDGRVLLGGATSSNTERLYVKGSSSTTSGIFIHNANGATNSSADLWFGNWSGSSTSAPQARISALNKNINTAATDLVFSIYDGNNTLERLRISKDGEVGIGTDNPAGTLSVYKASNPYFYLQNSASGTGSNDGFSMVLSGSDMYIANRESGILAYESPAGTERFRIASNGQVLVGNYATHSSINGNLEVNGNDGINISNATRTGSNGAQWRLIPHNGGGSATNLRLFEGTGGTEVINITKDGKVLVGTTSPSLYADRLLTVGDTSESSSTIEIRSATNGWGGLAFSDSTAADTNSYRGTIEYDHTNDRMQIRVAGDVIGRVVSSGNIQTLCTNSTNLDTSNTASAGNTHEFLYMRHSSTSITTGTNSFRVTTNGNVTNTNNSYGPLSDVKLKENIVDAGSQWDDFKAVRFRKFNFKEETGHETHTQLGVIAQELELTSPGLVYELSEKDMDGNPTGETTKAVMSSVLTSKGLVALQEAMARIETLEAEVAALKGS
jgi:hypothetical protein